MTLGADLAVTHEHSLAQITAPIERAADSRSLLVNRTKLRLPIERHTGAIAVLIHAADSVVNRDQVFRDVVCWSELDEQSAAGAATGAGGDLGQSFQHVHRVMTWFRKSATTFALAPRTR